MAIHLPLVIGSDGLVQQLQFGDNISVPANTPSIRSVTNGEASAAVWAYVLSDTNAAGADLAAIRANLTTVNGGVQLASLSIPYATNVA